MRCPSKHSKNALTSRRHSKRSSRTTSCTEGASPPQPDAGALVQQGSCERSGRRACEHCTPPAMVSSFDPVLQNERRSLGLGIGQRNQQLGRFFTPPAAHFRNEDHQSSPPSLSRQFGTGSFFPATCFSEDRSVLVCSTKPGGTVTS